MSNPRSTTDRGPWFISPEDAEARLYRTLSGFAEDCRRLRAVTVSDHAFDIELRKLYSDYQIRVYAQMLCDGALDMKVRSNG